MQSTINLFWHLYEHLPPLFPAEVALEMKNDLNSLASQKDLSVEGIEDKMIKYGYQIWPWNQAYKHFLEIAQIQLGEHFLLPKLSAGLHKKYLDFKAYGGGLKALHSGRPASFFTSEERGELCRSLVDMQTQLREYVNRELVGISKKKYLAKVDEYQKLLEKIKGHLESLRQLVAKEDKDSILGLEIKAKVRDFEQSLCLLGPELDYEAVCQAPEFFAGRKAELSRLRGINTPVEMDFFFKV